MRWKPVSCKGSSGAFLSAISALLLVFIAGCQQESSRPGSETQSDSPQTVDELLAGARTAMGAEGLNRVEFSGNGWEACLGQPWNINEGWARWRITDYDRVIDYTTLNSYQTAQRQAGMDPDKLGGCGAQPDAPVQNQQSAVTPESSWGQQLQVWMTPVGFLTLASQHDTQLENMDGDVVLDVSVQEGNLQYTVEGNFGDDMILDRISTSLDDTVFGTMAFETEFLDYRDFDGLMFPSRIIQKQGGYATLDLAITDAVANTDASAEAPPRQGGRFGGGPQAGDQPENEAIGQGIYALFGAYQSVVMEFGDFSVVIDGLQNDNRVSDIIRLAKQLVPEKPIGYVLTTHAHFDHSSGLRQFVAEGATIITQENNIRFFEEALKTPRLDPNEVSAGNSPVTVMGVKDFMAIDDGTQRLEIYKLNGSKHADDMLIAWIPSIKTIVEADLLQPWINPVFGGGDHPFLIYLADELDRLGLDYEQFVPVHRPPSPPLMTRADLLEAVGRQE